MAGRRWQAERQGLKSSYFVEWLFLKEGILSGFLSSCCSGSPKAVPSPNLWLCKLWSGALTQLRGSFGASGSTLRPAEINHFAPLPREAEPQSSDLAQCATLAPQMHRENQQPRSLADHQSPKGFLHLPPLGGDSIQRAALGSPGRASQPGCDNSLVPTRH